MATLCPLLKFREVDANGNPLVGGKIYAYEAGTTTPKDTYSDQAGTTPNANPIILDSAGRAAVYLIGYYDFAVHDSDDNLIYTSENVTGGDINDLVSTSFNEYSLVGQESTQDNDTYTWGGDDIDASASEIVIQLSGVQVVTGAGPGAFCMRLMLSSGEYSSAYYYGMATNCTTTDWNTAFSAATPTIGANTYIAMSGLMTDESAVYNGKVVLTKSTEDTMSNTDRWFVRVESYVGDPEEDGDYIVTSTGTVDIPNTTPIVGFKFYTDETGATTFNQNGKIAVYQYANTGSLVGANSGPFANHYTSTGTNSYTLNKMDNGNAGTDWFNGQEFVFSVANANTSTGVTIQPAGYATSKVVKMPTGSAPAIGFLRTNQWHGAHYDETADYVILDYPKIIETADLADGAVTSAKILDGTIATADLADGCVTSAKILDGTIATADIADSAITTAKIADGAITADKIDYSSIQEVSSYQTYVKNTALTYSHSLGARPNNVQVVAKCLIADQGYSVGDFVFLGNDTSGGSGTMDYGVSIKASTTQVVLNIGQDGIEVINASTHQRNGIADNSWEIQVIVSV